MNLINLSKLWSVTASKSDMVSTHLEARCLDGLTSPWSGSHVGIVISNGALQV